MVSNPNSTLQAAPENRGGVVFARVGVGAAVAALILGSAARMLLPSLSAFGIDEGIAAIKTTQLLYRGDFPLFGVKTSLYFYNPPLLIYLLAPLYSLNNDPVFPTLAFGVLGIAASLGMGWCAWRLGGRDRVAGLIAVTFASLCPLWIEHSRRLWGHALILPFTVAAMVFAIRWTLEWSRWALAGLIASVAAAQALHFSGTLLWIAFGLLWLLSPNSLQEAGPGVSRVRAFFTRRPPLRWGPVVVGVAIALLWYGPYAYHVASTGFEDARIIVDALRGRAQPSNSPIGSPLQALVLILGDAGHNDLMGIDRAAWPWAYAIELIGLRIVSAAILCGACLYAIVRMGMWAWKRGKAARARARFYARPEDTLLLWGLVLVAIPPLCFLAFRAAFVPAYLLPAAPGAVLLVAGLLAALAPSRSSQTLALTPRAWFAIVGLWGILSVANWGIVLFTLGGATPESKMFTAIRHQRQAVGWIAARAHTKPVLVTQGQRRAETGIDYSYFYLLWEATKTPERFRRLDDWKDVFLIRDSKETLQPDVAEALAQLDHTEFGNLVVYRAGREVGEHLLRTVESIPSGR